MWIGESTMLSLYIGLYHANHLIKLVLLDSHHNASIYSRYDYLYLTDEKIGAQKKTVDSNNVKNLVSD